MDEFYHLLNDLKMKFTEMQARHLAGHFPEFTGAGTEELEVTVAFSLIRASHTHYYSGNSSVSETCTSRAHHIWAETEITTKIYPCTHLNNLSNKST